MQDATVKLALKGLLEVTEASGKNIEASSFCGYFLVEWKARNVPQLNSDVGFCHPICVSLKFKSCRFPHQIVDQISR